MSKKYTSIALSRNDYNSIKEYSDKAIPGVKLTVPQTINFLAWKLKKLRLSENKGVTDVNIKQIF
tara:strand:- start:651 stop:845 length:195 start_codon:yes stop_codon:yes gene_type:complete